MPIRDKLTAWWTGLGITNKLWLVFGMLFTIFGLAVMAGFVGLRVVGQAENNILVNMEIRTKILEMEGQLERSRRLYQDFILRVPEQDFAAVRETYYVQSLAVAARVIALAEELKRLIATLPAGSTIARRNMDITLFTSTAKRYSHTLVNQGELLAALYHPDDGLQPRLIDTIVRLGKCLAGSQAAALLLRELDILEKRYEITRQRPYMQAALNKITVLRRLLPGETGITAAQRAEALQLLRTYEADAGRMLEIVRDMHANANDFKLQARAVDPISRELKRLSAEEVEQARRRITWASRLAGSIMAMAALLGLVCLVAAARVLHASITSKVVTMTRHAAAIRAGHLDEMLPNGTGDELGVLAGAFNAMTLRVKYLVETLEEKVRQRTQELADKNRELDATNQMLATLSMTDRLTGLCNRRKLDQSLEAEWRRAKRYGSVFSVVMVDLDNFKAVNDTYGHTVGDAVLVRAADLLVAGTRETDVVGRWGGEEFLIVCPETDAPAVMALAEGLRREFEASDFSGSGRMTASFGLAVYAGDAESGGLLERADAALYRAKEGGRNQVFLDPAV